MRYFYQSSFANYKIAQRTFIRSSWKRRARWHFFIWGLLLCGLLLLVFCSQRRGRIFSESIGPILVGGLVGGGIVSPLLYPWQLRRAYRNSSGANLTDRCYLEIEGKTLVSGIEGKSEGRFEHASILEVAEDEEALLLFVRKKAFLYLVKAALPSEAVADVHAWLASPLEGNDAH